MALVRFVTGPESVHHWDWAYRIYSRSESGEFEVQSLLSAMNHLRRVRPLIALLRLIIEIHCLKNTH
jgi:hypothetical protein